MTEYKYPRMKRNCDIYKTMTAGSLPTGTTKINELLVHPYSTSHSNHVEEVQFFGDSPAVCSTETWWNYRFEGASDI